MRFLSIFHLRGKTAMVAGGAYGIGRMIAKSFVDSRAKNYSKFYSTYKCEEAALGLYDRTEIVLDGRLGGCV